jgi:hypothetical protein
MNPGTSPLYSWDRPMMAQRFGFRALSPIRVVLATERGSAEKPKIKPARAETMNKAG